VLTDMSGPLGLAIGNAVEVEESVAVLAGGGPSDVVDLVLTLAREMLACAGLSHVDPERMLASGAAMDSWRAMVRAQGGEPNAPLPIARECETVRATRSGYVTNIDAYGIGVAAWRLGAGRARKEDPVSAAAGVVLHRRLGERVRAGDVLYELRADDASRIPAAAQVAQAAVSIGRSAPAAIPVVLDRIAHARGARVSGRSGGGRRSKAVSSG
jgi:thymidine phosphorylase